MFNTLLYGLGSQLAASDTADLETTISSLSVRAITIGTILLIVLVMVAVAVIQKRAKLKLPLFIAIATVVAATTLTISGATIYLNVKSATGGPVHWHADVEFWACGNELELRDPSGALSNKIGTPTLHEHNDKRIHLEGVPADLPHDASLGKFMNVIGGEVNRNSLVVPLNDQQYFANTHETEDGDGDGAPNPQYTTPYIADGSDGKYAKFISGEICNGQYAEVQVFAYRYDEAAKTYRQSKLTDPANYEISHQSQVPPGDCIIFEFAPPKERTDKLCKQYGVRDADRCADFGVEASKRDICETREVR